MKKLSIAMYLLSILIVSSCKKDNSSGSIEITPKSVEGVWSVVSDSVSSGIGAFEQPTTRVYNGTNGDYFKFTGAGKLYAKEGSVLLDTASYNIKDQQLNLTYNYLLKNGAIIPNASGNFSISDLTSHSLKLTNLLIAPGGFNEEFIVLKR